MNILFYDGSCGLCNHSVRKVFKWDKKGLVYYSPLQSEFAIQLGISKPGEDLSTVIFAHFTDINNLVIYKRSNAVLEISRILGRYFKLALIFKIVPGIIRDFFYTLVARNRHRFNFGKHDLCAIPEPELTKRIIHKFEDYQRISNSLI